MTISEFRGLAKAVATSAIKIPASVLAVAKRAITLRKEVTSWFLGRGDAASNMRHAHFIQVMEEVCDSLAWEDSTETARKTESSKTSADKKHEDATQVWVKRFAMLAVEEVDDSPDAETDQGEIIKVVAVEDEDDANASADDYYVSHAFFRLMCLFRDLQNWRTFISQTVPYPSSSPLFSACSTLI